MSLDVQLLSLSNKVYNTLKREGIVDIGEIVLKTQKELLKVPDFGRAALDEMEDALGLKGLSLGMSVDEWDKNPWVKEQELLQGSKYFLRKYFHVLSEKLKDPVYSESSLLKIIKITSEELHREIAAGRLRTTKIGSKIRFLVDDVLAWFDQLRDVDNNKEKGQYNYIMPG